MNQPTFAALVFLAAACHSETVSNSLTTGVVVPKQRVKKDHLSLADYGYLRVGMLRNEAEEIMMTPGVERSSSQHDSTSMALYEWNLGTNGDVTLRFENGKLIGKSQYGLR